MRPFTLAALALAALATPLIAPAALAATIKVLAPEIVEVDGEVLVIANIDAPRVNGLCQEERDLAQQAMAELDKLMHSGALVINRGGRDLEGRVLASITADGHDVGLQLVNKGLADYWEGRARSWCR